MYFKLCSDMISHDKPVAAVKMNDQVTNIKCKFCSSHFASKGEYLGHIESEHQGMAKKAYMCSDCGKQYKTKNELNQHIKSKCGTIKLFKCKVCNQELMSNGSLYNHMLRHKGERSFMCRFCAKLFHTAGQLKVHERIHTQDKAYVCEICNKGFCHRQSLITHSTLHTGIKPFPCENCGNSFSCVGNLIKHRKTHADSCGLVPLTTHTMDNPSTKIKVKINTPATSRLKTLEKTKKLEQEVVMLKTELTSTGDESSSSVGELPLENMLEVTVKEEDSASITQQELKEESADVERPRKKTRAKNDEFEKDLKTFLVEWKLEDGNSPVCKYCKRSYKNARWLYRHVRKNHLKVENGDKQPSHQCSFCKNYFFTKEECLLHQQTTHAADLTCQHCKKIFGNPNSLHAHIKNFHVGTQPKVYRYICDKCGQSFKKIGKLHFHAERKCDRGPLYDCGTCDKQFTCRYTRNNHMRVHDPMKKLTCKFCSKNFRWKGQLKIHERTHTGEKPFACLYCPKSFAYRESLMTHSSIHTGVKPHLCDSCGSRFSCIGNLIKHRSSHAAACGAWVYKNQKTEQASEDKRAKKETVTVQK